MKADTQTTSSSEPNAGATAAPVTEAPVTAAPVREAPVVETPARSDTPAPMETGGVGDGQSWAERIEAGADEGFQRARPAKLPQSQSRRREPRPPLPFPLQDSEGRLASVLQLYDHVAEQPVAHHNVAGRGIMHLHLEMLPQKARRLGNQVTCMIAEYHLTGSARGPLSLSPIIPEEAAALLPPLKNYVPSVAFEGTRDVRVVDRARTLQAAVWLHRLDMAMEGEGMASETLEASRHCQGPLLESFLTPRTSNLTFQEVVDCILNENQRASEQSLHYLRARHVRDHEVLDELTRAHQELDKSDKSSRRNIKKEIDQRRKSLETLRECISYYESQLGQDLSEGDTPDDDGLFGHGAQAEMAPAPGVNDAPSESTMTPASDSPPAEGQTQDMEVDDEGIHSHPASPISRKDDDLLTGSEAIGVESDLAHLTVSSPRGPGGKGEEASD